MNRGRLAACTDKLGQPSGPLRVWLSDQEMPGLTVTRSFGNVVAAQVGVHCSPETTVTEICKEDRIVLVGTDSFWLYVSNSQVLCVFTSRPWR